MDGQRSSGLGRSPRSRMRRSQTARVVASTRRAALGSRRGSPRTPAKPSSRRRTAARRTGTPTSRRRTRTGRCGPSAGIALRAARAPCRPACRRRRAGLRGRRCARARAGEHGPGSFSSRARRPPCGRASPKSVTRARPSASMSTLSGLKSRWTSPAAWAAARPSPGCDEHRDDLFPVVAPAASQAVRVSPSTSSIATYTSSSTAPTSCTATTLGWDRRASARPSPIIRVRAIANPSGSKVERRTLRAILRSS